MIFAPIIIYIFTGDFNTDCIDDIEDDDHIINRIFTKINNFISPDYK